MQEPAATRVESSDGVTVVAYDHGGDGPPVIFCHATGFHGRYWDPVCRRLSDTFRCITIDLRGHGDSVIPEELTMDWQGMGQDILAVVDAFGLERVRAVGHSMGGCSLLIAEHRRPGLVERAWLCEPIVIPSEENDMFASNDNRLVDVALRRREVFESLDAVFERYASRPPFATVDPEALHAYIDHGFREQADGTVILKCRGKVESDVFAHSRTDMFGHLPGIHAPTVVAGSADGDGPAAIAPKVADALPNGSFEYLDGLTHFAPLEDPARTAESIRKALA